MKNEELAVQRVLDGALHGQLLIPHSSFSILHSSFFFLRYYLVGHDGFGLVFQLHLSYFLALKRLFHALVNGLRNDDLVGLGSALQALAHVHGVADDGVVEAAQ